MRLGGGENLCGLHIVYRTDVMEFNIERACEVLDRTPGTLRSMLEGLSDDWARSLGDVNDWSPFDVVGHLIHGEETDWIPRAKIILEQGSDRTFVPFDRTAQFQRFEGKNLAALLDEFAALRKANLSTLRSWKLPENQLLLTGKHPELGTVTLAQLLATWVVHDLTHIRQKANCLARRYKHDVGPWEKYLSILN